MNTSTHPGAEHPVTRLPMPGAAWGARSHQLRAQRFGVIPGVAVYRGSMPQVPHHIVGLVLRAQTGFQGTGTVQGGSWEGRLRTVHFQLVLERSLNSWASGSAVCPRVNPSV